MRVKEREEGRQTEGFVSTNLWPGKDGSIVHTWGYQMSDQTKKDTDNWKWGRKEGTISA